MLSLLASQEFASDTDRGSLEMFIIPRLETLEHHLDFMEALQRYDLLRKDSTSLVSNL